MKNKKAWARVLALGLSVAIIGGNMFSSVAATPDNGADPAQEQVLAEKNATDIVAQVVVDANMGTVEGETTIRLAGDNGDNAYSNNFSAKLPNVVANPAYEFTGWTVDAGELAGKFQSIFVNGENVIEAKGWKSVADRNKKGTITVTATFKEAVRDLHAEFNMTENGYFQSGETTVPIDAKSNETVILPEVVANQGWKFVGWKSNVTDEIVTGTEANLTKYAYFDDYDNKYYVVFNPVFEKDAVTNVKVTVDLKKGSFDGYGDEVSELDNILGGTDTVIGYLPTVIAKENYEFTGWNVLDANGTVLENLEATATSFDFGTLDNYVIGNYTIEAVFTENAPEDKTADVVFKIANEKAATFKGIGGFETTYSNIQDSKYVVTVPELEINPGYELTGWEVVDGADTIDKVWPKDTTEITFNGPGKYTVNVKFAEKKRVSAFFSSVSDKGNIKGDDDNYVAIDGVVSGKVVALPTVEAKPNWKFVGWTCNNKLVFNDKVTEVTYEELEKLAFFAEGSDEGFVSFEAAFEVDEPEKKEVNVHFSVDTDYVKFVDAADQDVITRKGDKDDKVSVPAVKAVEGYKFTGWEGYGKDEIKLDAEATELGGVSLLANDGEISLTAKYEKIVDEPEKKEVNVHFSVDTDYVKFVDAADQDVITRKGDQDDKVSVPAVKAVEGYKFTGWEGYGKDEIKLDAEATELGGVSLLANDGEISLTAKYEKIVDEPEKKEVNVHFSVDTNYVKFVDAADQDVITRKGDEDDKVSIPAVKAVEGYKFTGWEGYGKDEIKLDAEATELGGVSLLANDGEISLTAKYEKIAVENKPVSIYFSVNGDMGEFVSRSAESLLVVVDTTADKIDLPKVRGINGYTFDGWVGTGKDEIKLDADATELGGLQFIANFADPEHGTIALEAKFTKNDTPEVKPVANATVTVDPEKGSFKGYDGVTELENKNLQDADYTLGYLPEVVANEGYEFTGWLVTDAEENVVYDLDAAATSIAFAPVAGEYTVAAKFVEKEAEVQVVNATVTVDPEKGSFKGYDGATKLENKNLQEADYTLGYLPEVVANDGYVFTGWKVTNEAGADIYTLDATATSIAFPYGVGDHYIVTATFEEVTPENPGKPDPENPGKPDPENPGKPNPEKPSKPEKPAKPAEKPGAVQTGDVTSTTGLVVLMLAAVAVISGLVFKKKHN